MGKGGSFATLAKRALDSSNDDDDELDDDGDGGGSGVFCRGVVVVAATISRKLVAICK